MKVAIDKERLGRMTDQLPLGRDPHSVRRRIEAMETQLERLFHIPVINRPVGLDAVVGLVPVLGDVVTTAMGAWRCVTSPHREGAGPHSST